MSIKRLHSTAYHFYINYFEIGLKIYNENFLDKDSSFALLQNSAVTRKFEIQENRLILALENKQNL